MMGNSVQEFEEIKSVVMEMAERTCISVDLAIEALLANNCLLANEVRKQEKEVDQLYNLVDELCLSAFTGCPRSRSEVNYLSGSLKIAIELERICDYGNQIAKSVQQKFSFQDVEKIASLGTLMQRMKNEAVGMLREAVQAYSGLDASQVSRITKRDDLVDKANREIFRNILCLSSVNPWIQETVLDYYTISRYIERCGDRAANIAEIVYYIIYGENMKKSKGDNAND